MEQRKALWVMIEKKLCQFFPFCCDVSSTTCSFQKYHSIEFLNVYIIPDFFFLSKKSLPWVPETSSALSVFCQVFIVTRASPLGRRCRPSANTENSRCTREKPLVPRVRNHCCYRIFWQSQQRPRKGPHPR